MPPKTSVDLVTSLVGSSFRRSVCDARTRFVRSIPTHGHGSLAADRQVQRVRLTRHELTLRMLKPNQTAASHT